MKPIFRTIEKTVDAIIRIMAALSNVIIIYLMLSVCTDVVLRFFFNRPQAWIVEISEYLLLYVTFLGAAWVLKNEGHVIVDILLTRASPKTNAVLGIFSSVIGVFVCLVIFWFGSIETLYHFKRGVLNPSILEFPKAPLLAVIPFGSFFFMLQFIRRTLGFIRALNPLQ
jgi:TRAP-type C4-dicarboxylate transport system permease small subunit